MTHKFWRIALTVFGIGLAVLVWPSLPVAGQAPEPALNTLMVELWPEYDRPEVLVIYRVELSLATPLPAEVTFPLPGYIDDMFVVAVEQNGSLFEAPPDTFFLSQEGGQTLFTLSTPERRFQFEYYDPEILRRQADTRTLTFEFSAPYAVNEARFQVQEPVGASDFTLTPAAENSFIGPDGLNYSRVERVDLAPAETVTLSATYRRDTNALTAQNSTAGSVPNQADSPANIAETDSTATVENDNLTLGYVLIGVGGLLFLAAAGSWWWSRRQRVTTRPVQRKPAADRAKRSRGPGQSRRQQPAVKATAAFCYQCGTALRSEANFCHNCGAERR